MLAVVFGQLAMSVYACPAQRSAAAALATDASAPAGSGPCADMIKAPLDAQGNACEIHCTDGIVTAAQPDLPPAAFIALPAPTIAVTELRASDECPNAALVPVSRAPPLALQFCRLLI
jgi:hypothetical protein